MATVDVLVMQGLTIGRKVRLARVARGWRQIELASHTRLTTPDITNIERDRPVHRWKLKRVLETLELEGANEG